MGIKMGANESNNKIESKIFKVSRYQLYVTIGLFLVGMFVAISTCDNMNDQVAEMKHATELEWRPYLNIRMDSIVTILSYDLSEGGENDTLIIRSLLDIEVGSDSFRAINRLVCTSFVNFRYWNSGKTPLWFSIRKFGLISSTDWNNSYKKTARVLFQDILNTSDFDSLETDILLNPGETKNIGWFSIPDTAFFAKYEIDNILDSGNIVVYPYLLAEYKDCFNHYYNAILIHYHQLAMKVHERKLTYKSRYFSVEQYEWWDKDN